LADGIFEENMPYQLISDLQSIDSVHVFLWRPDEDDNHWTVLVNSMVLCSVFSDFDHDNMKSVSHLSHLIPMTILLER
jgi:hypothetical protein